MFRFNCRHHRAYTYIAKTYSNKIVLRMFLCIKCTDYGSDLVLKCYKTLTVNYHNTQIQVQSGSGLHKKMT